MRLPTRQEVLGMAMPVESRRVSVTPQGVRSSCVYRYPTEAARDAHLVEEARALRDRGSE